MNLSIQKRIAAKLLKCGESRVWMSPAAQEKIKHAITRRDVRGLIKDGLINKLPAKKSKGIGTKARMAQKAKGRRSDRGSRKGSAGAREGKKEKWLKIVRPQRNLLRSLRKEGKLTGGHEAVYRHIKGGVFRSKRHLISHLEESKLANVSLIEFEAAEKARKAEAKQASAKVRGKTGAVKKVGEQNPEIKKGDAK